MEVRQNALIKEMVLLKYANNTNFDIQMALDYLKATGDFCMIPYRRIKQFGEIEVGFDDNCKLPYVINNGKRLYFPASWSEKRVEYAYRDYIESENITGIGIGYKERLPHQYQTDDFKVENDDVLIDVGCAEGLLALDVVEKVGKVYIVECDKQWIEALWHTFSPFKDKVQLINKMLSDRNSDCSVTLESVLAQEAEKQNL